MIFPPYLKNHYLFSSFVFQNLVSIFVAKLTKNWLLSLLKQKKSQYFILLFFSKEQNTGFVYNLKLRNLCC